MARKKQQYCSDCGAYIGDARSARNEAVCSVCADARRIACNEKQKQRMPVADMNDEEHF